MEPTPKFSQTNFARKPRRRFQNQRDPSWKTSLILDSRVGRMNALVAPLHAARTAVAAPLAKSAVPTIIDD
jgi:hypothetical protein